MPQSPGRIRVGDSWQVVRRRSRSSAELHSLGWSTEGSRGKPGVASKRRPGSLQSGLPGTPG
eukprot:15454922-Alexandrium_andersonii.AAC.1